MFQQHGIADGAGGSGVASTVDPGGRRLPGRLLDGVGGDVRQIDRDRVMAWLSLRASIAGRR